MTSDRSQVVFAARALLAGGWARDVAITIADGAVRRILQGVPCPAEATRAAGPVLPTLPNLHSHAFQRAMAGLAETAGPGDDSFWTWRETMYGLVGRLTPEDVEAVATRLYVDMLKAGYGAVAEFHYVHHDADGRAYADRAEMAHRVLAAATTSGIGLTLLPVFYRHGNFGGAEPAPGQRRFLNEVDAFLRLWDDSRTAVAAAGRRMGVAVHSLRAATPDQIRAVLAACAGPVHIHVAEQEREVADCIAWSGRRPVAWLLDEMPVDAGWCLIHATHMDEQEVTRLAAAGAVAGLCPTTEASLGDGLFPAVAYGRAGGVFGVGSDSQVSTSPAEELRTLEYGQRLRDRRRVRLAGAPGASNGRSLFDAALAGGSQALGTPSAGLREGQPASFMVLDGADPFIAVASDDQILDRWIFGGRDRAVRDVMVDGQWRIRAGRHDADEAIDRRYAAALRRLAA